MSLARAAAVSSRSLSLSARPKATVTRSTRASTVPVSNPVGAKVTGMSELCSNAIGDPAE